MTRTEERLTEALAARAAAVAADSIRPLTARDTGRFRRHLAGRRWSVSLAPLAAAAAIATITSVVAMLPHHHQAGPALTGLPRDSALIGVAAVSASDAWAVGAVVSGRRFLPLIMHWNGTDWARSRIAVPGQAQVVRGVAAVSARDAWAVGEREDKLKRSQPSILHWNGAEWKAVPTPRLHAAASLAAVATVSATDIWAVGEAKGALILHWNGSRWRIAPNPWHLVPDVLSSVFARSADDVWAVGRDGVNPLILHWNGVSWTRLEGPKPGLSGSSVYSVAAVSPRLAWLVGDTEQGQPLILRWNGSTLRQVPGPKVTPTGVLTGVSAVSAGQAWAVGKDDSPRGTQTLIFRWQGHVWVRVRPPASRVAASLRGVFALSAGNVWAVGYTGFKVKLGKAVILHWNGSSWQATA